MQSFGKVVVLIKYPYLSLSLIMTFNFFLNGDEGDFLDLREWLLAFKPPYSEIAHKLPSLVLMTLYYWIFNLSVKFGLNRMHVSRKLVIKYWKIMMIERMSKIFPLSLISWYLNYFLKIIQSLCNFTCLLIFKEPWNLENFISQCRAIIWSKNIYDIILS